MHTLNDISCMKEKLVKGLDYEMTCKGTDGMSVEYAGQVVDMIKDLAQAEKDCMEACYYKSVVGAMDDYGFDNEHAIEEYGRMGYDTRRYSSGRYAPKGAGHYSPVHGRSGYTMPPATHIPPYMMDNSYPHEYRMGYPSNGENSGNRSGYPMDSQTYGRSMQDYKNSKRYYTETKDPNEREKMDRHAKDHVTETVGTFKEIWEDATPDLKRDMKNQLSRLVAEMQV